MKLKTILFDLDGTIVDSALSIRLILNQMRKELNLKPFQIELYKNWISLGVRDLIANSLELSPNQIERYIAEFRDRYAVYKTPKSTLFPDVVQTLSDLKLMGIEMGICSNKPTYLCHRVLEDANLEQYFSSVVGGDKALKSKPSREPVDFALRELNHGDGMAVLVGDSSIDQRAAMAADIPFIFFLGGYNDCINRDQTFGVINGMQELIPLLKMKGIVS